MPIGATMAGMSETAADILAFWFGKAADEREMLRRQSPLWWSAQPAMDRQIAERFGRTHADAVVGRLDGWAATPRGRLAGIIVLDQFPRMMFRGDARAFASDALGRRWTDEGLARGDDRTLAPIERVFFYLPLEHSEAPADQERSVALFRALRDGADPALRERFDEFFDYAIRHRDIIARFGRFPHRNAILGRASTAEEAQFLTQPGSSF